MSDDPARVDDKEQTIYNQTVERLLDLSKRPDLESDDLRLLLSFIKDQKLSAIRRQRKPKSSIRDLAADKPLPFPTASNQ